MAICRLVWTTEMELHPFQLTFIYQIRFPSFFKSKDDFKVGKQVLNFLVRKVI